MYTVYPFIYSKYILYELKVKPWSAPVKKKIINCGKYEPFDEKKNFIYNIGFNVMFFIVVVVVSGAFHDDDDDDEKNSMNKLKPIMYDDYGWVGMMIVSFFLCLVVRLKNDLVTQF